MNTIKKILELSDYESVESMELNDQIEVDGGAAFMDLTIEKVGEIRLSVAHYYTQRGDLMSDPQVVFDIRKDEWVPLRFINSPHIEDFDETGLDQHTSFIEQWDENLENQGFVDRAKTQFTED
jgi:hypothetical protein